MSMAVHSTFSRKTFAVALAAGVAIGGVQIASPSLGLNTVAEASAAELDPSVVVRTSVVSDKSGANILTLPDVEASEDSRTEFFNTHGNDHKLNLTFKIPDNAAPGDTFAISWDGMQAGVTGSLVASTDAGRKVGSLDILSETKAVFTVSPDVASSVNRTATFVVPVRTAIYDSAGVTYTDIRAADGKTNSSEVKVSTSPDALSVFTTLRYRSRQKYFDWILDKPDVIYKGPDISTGVAAFSLHTTVGHADTVVVSPGDTNLPFDDVYALDEDADATRDFVVRYSVDDPDARFVINKNKTPFQAVKKFSPTSVDRIGGPGTQDMSSVFFFKDIEYVPDVNVVPISDSVLELHVKSLPSDVGFNLNLDFIKVESPYVPGKTVTVKGEFVDGVGKPHSSFDMSYNRTYTNTQTMPSFGAYGSADDIKRSATLKVDVNGNDAQTKAAAESVSGGKADFTLTLKNTGNIGAGSATITLPKGMTTPEGETTVVHNFGNEGFPAGSEKAIVLKGLNVPEGVHENLFRVDMTGYSQLSDAAWTNYTTVQTITPKYPDNTDAPRNKETTVSAPTGGVPGITYAPGMNVPTWAKVNPDGTITVNPGYDTPSGPTKVNVKVNYPQGYTGPDYIDASVMVGSNSPDLHITDVEKTDDNTYTLTRSDGATFTIDISDLTKRLDALENVDAPTQQDFEDLKKDLKDVTDKIGSLDTLAKANKKAAEDLVEDLKRLNDRVQGVEDRITAVENAAIKEVRDNGDGTYTLIRQDDTEVPGTIGDGQNIKEIRDNGDGSITLVRANGDEETVQLAQVKIEETGVGTPQHTVTITSPNGTAVTFNVFDTHVIDVKKNNDGDYVITNNAGKTWTIALSDLRDQIAGLEGKDAALDARLDEIAAQIDQADTGLSDLAERISNNEGAIEEHRKTLGEINETIGEIRTDVTTIQDELVRLDNQDVAGIRDNGDGTYTLIRKDGGEITGAIGDGAGVKEIRDNGDGSITLIRANGDEETVQLAQVSIAEDNAGTPEHTVTITLPNGDAVTFNVFDKHVIDVKREDNGNYTVVRSDGATWTIDLADIREKIAALEAKDSPSRDEYNAVKQELNDLSVKIDNEFAVIDTRFTKVEGDIDQLRSDVSALENRVTKVEARLDKVEGDLDAITKCMYGAGTAAIPAALSIPLMLLAQVHVPAVEQLNTQIQQQLGIFNPDMARMWGEYGGVLQAGAVLAGLAGVIGGIAYIADQCAPLTKTDAAQQTGLGQFSSKLDRGNKDAAKPAEELVAAE